MFSRRIPKNIIVYFLNVIVFTTLLCSTVNAKQTKVSLTAKSYNVIDLRKTHRPHVNSTSTIKLVNQTYTVLYFLSSECPCSQSHFDYLNKLQKNFSQYVFYGLHSNKYVSLKKAKNYFSTFEINFPIIHDKNLFFANLLKAVKTPHVFIINPQGEVVFQGGATDSRNPQRAKRFYLQQALSELANNKDVTIKDAKTIGCYIQR